MRSELAPPEMRRPSRLHGHSAAQQLWRVHHGSPVAISCSPLVVVESSCLRSRVALITWVVTTRLPREARVPRESVTGAGGFSFVLSSVVVAYADTAEDASRAAGPYGCKHAVIFPATERRWSLPYDAGEWTPGQTGRSLAAFLFPALRKQMTQNKQVMPPQRVARFRVIFLGFQLNKTTESPALSCCASRPPTRMTATR